VTDTIYFDHNSTTPIDPSVAQTIFDCYAKGYVNPASQHRPGQLARQKLEQIRRRIVPYQSKGYGSNRSHLASPL